MPIDAIEVVAIEAPRSFCVSSHSPGTLRQAVVAGNREHRFTLPLVEVNSGAMAGHVHASWKHFVHLCADFVSSSQCEAHVFRDVMVLKH